MQFAPRKRRGPPAVIIVSLIDVLIVVLIFLMVTTSFKHRAPFKVVLPKSGHAQRPSGSNPDQATVSVSSNGVLSWEGDPMIFDKLKQQMKQAAAANTNLSLDIRGDEGAPWGKILEITDIARDLNIKKITASADAKPAK